LPLWCPIIFHISPMAPQLMGASVLIRLGQSDFCRAVLAGRRVVPIVGGALASGMVKRMEQWSASERASCTRARCVWRIGRRALLGGRRHPPMPATRCHLAPSSLPLATPGRHAPKQIAVMTEILRMPTHGRPGATGATGTTGNSVAAPNRFTRHHSARWRRTGFSANRSGHTQTTMAGSARETTHTLTWTSAPARLCPDA